MPKYEVIEDVMNQKGDKRQLRIVVSPDETIFLNLPSESSSERIDAEVDLFLANRELMEAQARVEEARLALRNI